ncbi:hypothetical protein GCM10027589_14370 [Actinocorallia lasiicapitis]
MYLERMEQAEVLFKPQRVEVLRLLAEPRTCGEVGEILGQSKQRVYYHVKVLEEAGLVVRVSERKVRGVHEGIYQAAARAYWMSPRLVGHLGGLRRVQDAMSLGYLLDLVEEVQCDVAAIDPATVAELPSLAVSGTVALPAEQRQEFLAELQSLLTGLFARYGGAEGESFKLAVACYPHLASGEASSSEASSNAAPSGAAPRTELQGERDD